MFHRLTLNDGKLLLVGAPKEFDYDLVRAHHQLLLDQVIHLRNFDNPEADIVFFPEFSDYYLAIADRLTPAFDPRSLAPQSRHEFFIATSSFPHPKDPDTLIRGLSHLEQLMGFEYDDEAIAQEDEVTTVTPNVIISTGNLGLDIRATLLLNCKENCDWLIRNHTRTELVAIIEQMANLSNKEEVIKERQRQADREKFQQSSAQIAHYLQAEGYVVPVEFLTNNN